MQPEQSNPNQPQTTQPMIPPSPVVESNILTNSSKMLAIWALVLAILGFISGIFWFISVPIAVIALILSILTLVKRKAGKGLAIAAAVIAGITLVIAPFWILTSLANYNATREKAQQMLIEAQERESSQN